MAEAEEQQETLSRTIAGGSDVVFDYICQPCRGDGKNLEAVGFCVNCSEFLCDECFKYHLKPTLMTNHKLLNIDEAKKDTSIAVYQDTCTEKCPEHRGEVLKYFCSDHNDLACIDCVTLDHRNCQGLQYIPKIAKGQDDSAEYEKMVMDLDTIIGRTEDLSMTSKGNKSKSLDVFTNALKAVKQVKKDAALMLGILEKEIEAEAEKMKQNDIQKMDANIESCDNTQKYAKSLASNLHRLKDNRQYCNLFVAMKTNKLEIKSMNERLDLVSNDNAVKQYLFQPSKQLEQFLKFKSSYGELCMQDGTNSKPIRVGEIRVKTNTDTNSHSVWRFAILPGTQLVAVDFDDVTVKLIDTKQIKVISDRKLRHCPHDVTATDKIGEIAVTLPGMCKVVFLKIRDNKLYEDWEINTSGTCYGLASLKDKLVVSLEDPERVEIIDKQGNVLQTISHDKTGKQLFGGVCSVSVSQDMGAIYVPDCQTHTVTCLSVTGQVKGIYQDKDLKGPTCVAIDQRGYVYVGGENSKNIHQITPDCKKIKILLTEKDGLGSLQTLCYCTDTDRLYAGQFNGTIKVYQL